MSREPLGVVVLRATPVAPEPRVERLSRWLSEAGWAVRVIAWDRECRHPPYERRDGATIERVRIPAEFGAGHRSAVAILRWQLALLWRLWRARRAYDVVHACDFDTALPARLMASLLGKRMVYEIYDFYVAAHALPAPLVPWVRRAELAVAHRADAVIIVDERRECELEGTPVRRLAVLYNAPDDVPPVSPAPARTAGALRIGFVGLLVKERGLFEMLDVVRARPEWQLTFAGYGIAEPSLRDAAGAAPNVRFLGRLTYDRTLALLAEQDVLFATYDPALPIHRRSSANKLFEALALGRPIIVAKGTGMDSVVAAEGIGTVVPYGDRDALAAALAGYASWSAQDAADFAARARALFDRRFSGAVMRRRLLQVYAGLGATRDGPAAA